NGLQAHHRHGSGAHARDARGAYHHHCRSMTRRINAPRARHLRPGLTLVEMIMSITVFTIVFGVATRVLLVQSTGFREANVSVNAQQNLRFAADIIRQDVALAGANVPDHQPVLVYANATSFAFNADYTSNLPGNAAAVF